MNGYIVEEHPSKKYLSCRCSKCLSWIGMIDKATGEPMHRENECRNGHVIDWTLREERKQFCRNCHNLIIAWGNERHEYECGEHKNDVPGFEKNGIVYKQHCFVELDDTCEYWTEKIEPIVSQKQGEVYEQLSMF